MHNIVGNTPLIKIGDSIYAKLETYNPTGSIKDRLISYLVRRALERKEIGDNTILVEATSGNTGISLAAFGAALGLKTYIIMPENMSQERKTMLHLYGAELIEVPAGDFTQAIEKREEFLADHPTAWSPKQFENPENIECHFKTTALEIHNEIGDNWSYFVHGAGTGGTMMGVHRYITANELITKTALVVPAEYPHGIQGINDGKDFLLKKSLMDCEIVIKTCDAIARARAFCQQTGYLVGISSGANIIAAEKIRDIHSPTGIIVTMLSDRGERYLSIY